MPDPNNPRLVLATLVAPLAVPVALVVVPVISCACWPFYYDLPWILGFAVPVSYLATLLVGLPLTRLLKKKNRLNLQFLVAGGTLMGTMVFYIFSVFLGLLLTSSPVLEFSTYAALFGAVLGLLVSLTFGLVAGITWRSSGTPAGKPAAAP
ncbi:hypothetical protein [Nitrogeniibacter aestuarii]|uniref:hypothetical protein n=1 Tax=Nitrogeniibacter aestuarii TaxID=2815343 RepID=UPI001D1068E8|nr:hypothetical protein [Nitrogeniibacter aestuarii]